MTSPRLRHLVVAFAVIVAAFLWLRPDEVSPSQATPASTPLPSSAPAAVSASDAEASTLAAFDAWLDETAKAPGPEREARLTQWDKAPSARECHPREEHLLPLMVVAGAAGDSKGTRDFNDKIGGKVISGFRFG